MKRNADHVAPDAGRSSGPIDRHEDIMSDTEQVWELMKKIGICMLVSCDGKELQARPMGAYVRPDEHAVFFLADARHHKD